MNFLIRRFAWLWASLLVLGGADLLWAAGPGTKTANYLRFGVGGRGVAMAGAQTAASEGAPSLYWNPAGLAMVKQQEVMMMYNKSFQSISHTALYYAHPSLEWGVWGFGVQNVSYGTITGTDESANPTGNVAASDVMVSGGWGESWRGRWWLPPLKTGLGFKVLRKTLAETSAMGYLADVGVIHHREEGRLAGLTSGLVVTNLGSGLTFEGSSSAPRDVKAGVSYPFYGGILLTALDVVFPSDGSTHLQSGIDWKIRDVFSVRAGYRQGMDQGTGFSFGAGIGNERIRFDYAFAPYGELGDAHRVSLTWRFGQAFRQAEIVDQLAVAYQRAEALYGQGYVVEAIMQARRIQQVAPWHGPSQKLIDRMKKEITTYENVARQEALKDQIREHMEKGEAAFNKEDLLSARAEFEAILTIQPDSADALRYLDRIQERYQSVAQGFFQDGMEAFAYNDYRKAVEFFQKVLIVDPNHLEAADMMQKTRQLLREKQQEAEIATIQGTIQSLMAEGKSAYDRKDYEAAMKIFTRVLKMDVENSEAAKYRNLSQTLVAQRYYEAGVSAARKGAWATAKDWLDKTLEVKPDYPDAREALAKVLSHVNEENKVKGQQKYREALEYFLNGNLEKAAEMCRDILLIDPDMVEAKRMLERIQLKSQTGP